MRPHQEANCPASRPDHNSIGNRDSAFTNSVPYVSAYSAKSSTPSTCGVGASGSGIRISWNGTLVRDSGAVRICSSRTPLRPASSTPALSTRCCRSALCRR